jgi:hypothetical protein
MKVRKPLTDLSFSLTGQTHERLTLLRVWHKYCISVFFSACHSLMDTKTCYLTFGFASVSRSN